MTEPSVGQELAESVADRLQAGQVLAHSHPEYCGVGLQFAEGQFVCAEVYDGQLPTAAQFLSFQERGEDMEYRAFATRATFVAWLAEQTDSSLSGRELSRTWLHNNQRLSIARLREFVAA